MNDTTPSPRIRVLRGGLILLLALLAFVASYRVAQAASGRAADRADRGTAAASSWSEPAPGGSAACACCGGAGTGERIERPATIDADGVQRITVDTANGYDPSVIVLAAGAPAEITFRQASGCLGQVMSTELGFFEDLTAGDATVRLEPLEPGTYQFSCGMRMVFGEIVVK